MYTFYDLYTPISNIITNIVIFYIYSDLQVVLSDQFTSYHVGVPPYETIYNKPLS